MIRRRRDESSESRLIDSRQLAIQAEHNLPAATGYMKKGDEDKVIKSYISIPDLPGRI